MQTASRLEAHQLRVRRVSTDEQRQRQRQIECLCGVFARAGRAETCLGANRAQPIITQTSSGAS